MKTVIYKSDSDGVTAIGNKNPLPVTSAYDSSISFSQQFHSENATAGSVVKAATSGKSIYITDIIVSAGQAGEVWLKDSSGTIFGPVYLAANGNLTKSFSTPVVVTEGSGLTVQTDGAIHISLQVNGYVA